MVGLMIGVVVTALVQSSSTSSSIIVSMVAADCEYDEREIMSVLECVCTIGMEENIVC